MANNKEVKQTIKTIMKAGANIVRYDKERFADEMIHNMALAYMYLMETGQMGDFQEWLTGKIVDGVGPFDKDSDNEDT